MKSINLLNIISEYRDDRFSRRLVTVRDYRCLSIRLESQNYFCKIMLCK